MLQRVVKILADILIVDERSISPDMPLSESSGIRPIDVAKLVIRTEEAYSITIHDEDVPSLKTIGAFCAYVQEIREGTRD